MLLVIPHLEGNWLRFWLILSHVAATSSLAFSMGVVVVAGLVRFAWYTMLLVHFAGTLMTWTWQLRNYLLISALKA